MCSGCSPHIFVPVPAHAMIYELRDPDIFKHTSA